DPMASLKSKDADERVLTAGMLIHRYRDYRKNPTGKAKQEPIDAAESKQILLALAEADWNKGGTPGSIHPQMAFGMLQLTDADGWRPDFKDPNGFQTAAKKWLKDNADKYRVKQFVPEKAEK